MKICAKCGAEKDLSEFYRYRNKRPHAVCIKCTKKRRKEIYHNRYKGSGMTDAEVQAYLEAHPIDRQLLRERFIAAMGGMRNRIPATSGRAAQ
jgi:recombinational DNA repair protein (RecF pathway)